MPIFCASKIAIMSYERKAVVVVIAPLEFWEAFGVENFRRPSGLQFSSLFGFGAGDGVALSASLFALRLFFGSILDCAVADTVDPGTDCDVEPPYRHLCNSMR